MFCWKFPINLDFSFKLIFKKNSFKKILKLELLCFDLIRQHIMSKHTNLLEIFLIEIILISIIFVIYHLLFSLVVWKFNYFYFDIVYKLTSWWWKSWWRACRDSIRCPGRQNLCWQFPRRVCQDLILVPALWVEIGHWRERERENTGYEKR